MTQPISYAELERVRGEIADHRRLVEAADPEAIEASPFLHWVESVIARLDAAEAAPEELTQRIEELLVERLGWNERADAAEAATATVWTEMNEAVGFEHDRATAAESSLATCVGALERAKRTKDWKVIHAIIDGALAALSGKEPK